MRSVGLPLVVATLIAGSQGAYADATPTPTPTPIVSYQTEMRAYKVAMEQFHIEMSTRAKLRKEITKNFISAVVAANNLARSAMRSAKTAESKRGILAQQKATVDFATSVRDAALVAMADAPIEPVKPLKRVELLPKQDGKSGRAKPTPTATP